MKKAPPVGWTTMPSAQSSNSDVAAACAEVLAKAAQSWRGSSRGRLLAALAQAGMPTAHLGRQPRGQPV
jgi:hypothetical protein